MRLWLGLIQVNARVRDNIQLLGLDYKGQLQLDGMEEYSSSKCMMEGLKNVPATGLVSAQLQGKREREGGW